MTRFRGILDGSGPWLSSGALMRPNGYHLIIWQFFARERDGQWGRLVLEEKFKAPGEAPWVMDISSPRLSRLAGMSRRTLAGWPGPVVEMLLRTKAPEERCMPRGGCQCRPAAPADMRG